MSASEENLQTIVEEAVSDKGKLKLLIEQLESAKRVDRQHAATAVHAITEQDPAIVAPYIDQLVDALNRPEAQTRWEILDALTLLVDDDARECGKALSEAETALFDEDSGPVRLAAMRFLCKYGSTTTSRSDKVWSLIDEGIQCYHGDLEFNDMLTALYDFSGGKLSKEVKQALADRMAFDATNGKGSLQRRAQQILDNIK